MNCEIALPKSLLEGADRRAHFSTWAYGKARRLRNQALDFLEIVHLIGRNPEAALRDERSMNGREKIVCHDTTTPMPPLWPGIGKEKMEYFNRSGRQ